MEALATLLPAPPPLARELEPGRDSSPQAERNEERRCCVADAAKPPGLAGGISPRTLPQTLGTNPTHHQWIVRRRESSFRSHFLTRSEALFVPGKHRCQH